jgi:hypothetical protein
MCADEIGERGTAVVVVSLVNVPARFPGHGVTSALTSALRSFSRAR